MRGHPVRRLYRPRQLTLLCYGQNLGLTNDEGPARRASHGFGHLVVDVRPALRSATLAALDYNLSPTLILLFRKIQV